MELLLIWYKPRTQSFLYKIIKGYYISNYFVGQVNDYGHLLVNILVFTDKGLFSCYDFIQFKESYFRRKEFDNRSLKNKVLDKVIDKLIGMKN